MKLFYFLIWEANFKVSYFVFIYLGFFFPTSNMPILLANCGVGLRKKADIKCQSQVIKSFHFIKTTTTI